MKQRFVIGVAGVIVICLGWWVSGPSKLRYHGEPLDYWSWQLAWGDPPRQAEAREALHSMGGAAVPHLIDELVRPVSPLKLKLYSFASHLPKLSELGSPDRDFERLEAAKALGEIGPAASNAIPALALATNTNSCYEIAAKAALMKIRNEPLEPLIKSLDDINSTNWSSNASIVAEFATNAQAAVPALVQALRSTNFGLHKTAESALGEIHANPQIAVPALIGMLDTNRPHFLNPTLEIITLAGALGKFEGEAKPAASALGQYLGDTEPFVSDTVFANLRKILTPNEVKAFLMERLKDTDPRVQTGASNRLNELDPKWAVRAGKK